MNDPGVAITEVPAPTGDAPPRWDTIDRDILCPLCDYNLRGLIEARCPECGHRFVWSEVLAVGDSIHRFLFEHQTHRSIWALYRTFVASLSPAGFWRGIIPTQTPVPARLNLYWRILLTPLIVTVLALILYENAISPFASKTSGMADFFEARLPLIVAILCWPWLTLLSLLIFRVSLAQARIKWSHVLRCVIYTHGPLLAAAPLLVLLVNRRTSFSRLGFFIDPLEPPKLIAAAIALVLAYGLGMAYRHYLRFPHVVATVIASQVIVWLVIVRMLLLWNGY